MSENFGLKIGLEGEKEFKKSLAEINNSFKVLGSEMKLVDSQRGSEQGNRPTEAENRNASFCSRQCCRIIRRKRPPHPKLADTAEQCAGGFERHGA